MINIFSKFTDRSRRVTTLAQEEARTLHHSAIGPEHFLLAMAAEGEKGEGGIAYRALTEVGFDPEKAREYLLMKSTDTLIGEKHGRILFTSSAQKLLEQSLREATLLGHNFIGTEHLLLGLISAERAEAGLAGEILHDQRIGLGNVSKAVMSLLENIRAIPDSTSALMDEIATLKSEVMSLRVDLLRARKRALEAEMGGLAMALRTIEEIVARED